MPLYSHSQLETFQVCPLKYKFRYLDKIRKPEEQSIEAFVGSCVHSIFQKLYDDLLLRKLNALEELLAHYRFVWERAYKPTIKIVRDDLTAENYFKYGEQCLRNYYARYMPFDQSQTLGTESHVVFSLDAGGNHRFQGYIDRLARRKDGTYEIHDYKTSRNLPSQAEADSERQLALYQVGLTSRWTDVERVQLIWHYVGLDSTLRSTRSPEQLRDLKEKTIALIDVIEGTTEFEPVKSNLCRWCEYRPQCPLWKHVEAVKDLPSAEFDADAGVQLADEYAQAKLEFGRMADRLDVLKETIIEFARQKEMHVLQGKGVIVTVNSRARKKFPGKDDPLRPALEALLKQSGQWDNVSELDVHHLLKMVEEEKWEPELLSQLRTFLTAEPGVSIHVTRVEDREQPPE
ncbi:MAG TPA: PD-(D/E)XK nuclease family protein [Terriglobia bacterium]|nr:PD-(D/E)XK nuclease family protein [Terriglobia bacterium]